MNKILPLCFVILWSSAFITSKIIITDSSPFAALSLRFALVTFGFAIYCLFLNYKFTCSFKNLFEALSTGILFHGLYLGGVFFALSKGLTAGVAALIVSLQPILTSILAGPFLGEIISWRQWVGIFLGFSGTILVLGFDFTSTISVIPILSVTLALSAATIGTLWQKKLSGKLPLAINNTYQALGAFIFLTSIMFIFEDVFINFSYNFILAMTWQILIVSFGAFTILMYLIKIGSASSTSSLFFLVPPFSAIMAWYILHENLFFIDIIGFLIATIGVYISTRTYNNINK